MTPQTYTDQDILARLRAFCEREGRTPSAHGWAQSRMSPSHATIKTRFGSWENAIKAADLPSNTRYVDGVRQYDGRPKWEETRTVVERLENGAKLRDIAKELGINAGTLSQRVSRYCYRHGVRRPVLRYSGTAEEREAAQMADQSRRID